MRSIIPKADYTITRSLFTLLALALALGQLAEAFAAVNRRLCRTEMDCGENECCAETPIGYKLCLPYEQQGELCFFRSRTPTCGCGKGLKCVSTMPMEDGEWGHDYVCARVRPFMHYKLLPYLEDTNELE